MSDLVRADEEPIVHRVLLVERRSVAPLVRLGILRIRTLATANGVLFIVVGGLFGMFFFASLYVQQVLGYSPLKAGLAFLPVTAGIVIGSVTAQQLIKRMGIRNVALAGTMIAAALAGLVLAAPVPARPWGAPGWDGPMVPPSDGRYGPRRGSDPREGKVEATTFVARSPTPLPRAGSAPR